MAGSQFRLSVDEYASELTKARSDAKLFLDISTRYFAKNMAGRNIDQISSKTPLHVETFLGGFTRYFRSIFPRTYQPYLPKHRLIELFTSLQYSYPSSSRSDPHIVPPALLLLISCLAIVIRQGAIIPQWRLIRRRRIASSM